MRITGRVSGPTLEPCPNFDFGDMTLGARHLDHHQLFFNRSKNVAHRQY